MICIQCQMRFCARRRARWRRPSGTWCSCIHHRGAGGGAASGLCRGLEAACRGADGEGRAVGGKIAVSGDIWFHFIRTA
ncbi:hypothetical protein NXV81_27885 [Bacteroides ovatus]|nr:hypothetical protein [Bacteroides ovatus]